MSSIPEGLICSCINTGREALPAFHFLTSFPRLLALPPESAAVSLARHLQSVWRVTILHSCWVSFGFVACSWIFCFHFLFWVSQLPWQYNLRERQGRENCREKKLKGDQMTFYDILQKLAWPYVDKKQSIVIISYCESYAIIVWRNYDILCSTVKVNEGRKQ